MGGFGTHSRAAQGTHRDSLGPTAASTSLAMVARSGSGALGSRAATSNRVMHDTNFTASVLLPINTAQDAGGGGEGEG